MTKLDRIAKMVKRQWMPCGTPEAGWTGMDFPMSGKQVRIAREGDDGEDISVYRFTDRMVMECKTSFDHAVPDKAIVAFVRELLK